MKEKTGEKGKKEEAEAQCMREIENLKSINEILGKYKFAVKHDLKILPQYFEDVMCGRKKFEIRKNDRDYKVGDIFILREWGPERGYTGRSFIRSIIYILDSCPEYGLMDGYIIFGW